jgi:mono/diheme cytochrome c family protein
LDGIAARRDAEFIRMHITNPDEHAKRFPELYGGRPSQMPHPNASPEEVNLLVTYLLTLPEPAAGFLVGGHSDPPPKGPAVVTALYTPAPATESSRVGQKLYYDQGCSACHAIGGDGGQFGPPLDGIGARRSRQFLLGHITNPQVHAEQFPGEHGGAATMPPTNASPVDIEQMTAFLLTLPERSQGEAAQAVKVRFEDYLAVSYIPAIQIERSGGETQTDHDTRNMVVYAAGPLGRNFSFFVQPLPLSEQEGFGGKFEMAQGQFNYGGSRRFLQVRFGQLFSFRNAGFAGTDRGLTDNLPLIFQSVNGFTPGALGRGVSIEYTLPGWTTLKAFGSYNEAADAASTGSDSVPTEFLRSRTYGFTYEKVIGTKGLNGVQFQFEGGRTPFSIADVRQSALRFQRYSAFVNRSLLDKKNFERLNAIAGVSLLRDNRFLGVDSDASSHGYGYFLEVDTVPIVDHLSCFGRFDLLRPTTLVSGNIARAGSAGVIYDALKYARMFFEYQRLDSGETANRFNIGWQFNF